MANSTPLKITLYNPETDEVLAEYTRLFVPWRLLKVAVRMAKTINFESLTEADVDALAAMVVDVFGDKFTVDQVANGADVGEMVTVLNAIVARAQGAIPNPPPPGNAVR
jgi:hypothetical protein